MAIIVFAMVTGQNVGTTKRTIQPTARTANESTMAPRLARVSSMAAPIGVCTASPRNPPIVVINPTSD